MVKNSFIIELYWLVYRDFIGISLLDDDNPQDLKGNPQLIINQQGFWGLVMWFSIEKQMIGTLPTRWKNRLKSSWTSCDSLVFYSFGELLWGDWATRIWVRFGTLKTTRSHCKKSHAFQRNFSATMLSHILIYHSWNKKANPGIPTLTKMLWLK